MLTGTNESIGDTVKLDTDLLGCAVPLTRTIVITPQLGSSRIALVVVQAVIIYATNYGGNHGE